MNFNDFKIGRAQNSDIPALSGLLHILFEQETDFAADSEKQQQGLRMIISNPNVGSVFVLKKTYDNEIIGMVSLLFTVSTAMGGRAAVLEDMVVLPEYRGMGLGSMLIDEAAGYALKHGLLRISLLTDCDNTEAISFYKKNGFARSEMIVMRKLL